MPNQMSFTGKADNMVANDKILILPVLAQKDFEHRIPMLQTILGNVSQTLSQQPPPTARIHVSKIKKRSQTPLQHPHLHSQMIPKDHLSPFTHTQTSSRFSCHSGGKEGVWIINKEVFSFLYFVNAHIFHLREVSFHLKKFGGGEQQKGFECVFVIRAV
jgi:hypothetical protein